MQTITRLSALIILFMTLTVPFGSRAAEQAEVSAVSRDINFRRDIFNRDQKVLDALNGAVIIQAPGP
jgi:hypothetical protein